MKSYEVEVTVKDATPPKNAFTPSRIVFVIRADNEDDAMAEAVNNAKNSQKRRPRIYKNATFVCVRPCIREAFSKDALH